jgi:aspartate/methionine/tyrosine aminotransferase
VELPPFRLDQWLGQNAERARFHLGGSTGPQWTLAELLQLDGADTLPRLLESGVAYGQASGRPDLREALAAMHGVSASKVLVVNGGSEALLHLFFHAARAGANVVVPFPGFPPYHVLPESLGLEVRTYPLRRENAYRIDANDVMRHVDAKTALVLVNSPHNPTGAAPTDDEMRELHDAVSGRGVQFVCDEVFHPIYHGPARRSASRLAGATVIGDLSKALSLPGLRIGWIVEPDDERRHGYVNAREYFSVSNTIVGEFFAEIAIRHREDILRRTREVTAANLPLVEALVQQHSELLDWVRPDGGMTAFIRLRGGRNARGLCEALLTEGILLTPGDCFNVPDHVRLGFGVERARFPEAMDRLGVALQAWRGSEVSI